MRIYNLNKKHETDRWKIFNLFFQHIVIVSDNGYKNMVIKKINLGK